MNTRPAGLMLLSTLGCLLGCAGPKPTMDQVAPPEITIQTVPRSATVTVDGVEKGITPMVFRTDSRASVHQLTFTRDGYLASELTVKGEDVYRHSGQQVLVYLRPDVWEAKTRSIDPDNVTHLTRAGQDLSKAGRCEEALPYLRRAVEVNPQFAPAHKALGTCYAKLKHNAQALEEYKLYLMYAPEAPDAAKVRAIVDRAQGDIELSPARND